MANHYAVMISMISASVLLSDFIKQYQTADAPKFLFGTKTPYRDVRFDGLLTTAFTDNENDACNLAQINSIIRHGTRNPGKKDIKRSQLFMSYIDANSNEDLFVGRKWEPKFVVEEEKDISETGRKELFMLGQTFTHLFKQINVPENESDNETVVFMSSKTNRTIGSCASFIDGFYGINEHSSNRQTQCVVRNDLIRFFDKCRKYISRVETNDTALSEVKLFRHGNEINQVQINISKRLNINHLIKIDYKHLKAVYTMLGVEIANFERSALSPIFTTEELKVLEYAADLKNYWKKSYGHPINYEQSCPLLQNVFQHLDDAVKNKTSYYKGIFRFGHAETVLPILTILGLYKDDLTLKADNFEQHTNRNFRTSYISPFATNVAFLLYNCGENYKLLLLHNEKPVNFPCCPSELMCPYNTVRQYYSQWIDKCEFDQMCSHTKDEL